MAVPTSSSVALITPVNNGGTLNDEFISGLAHGASWTFDDGPRILTYSLNINELTGTYPGGTPVPGDGGEWSAGMAAAFAEALARWENVANIDFRQISSGRYYFESSADLAVTLTGDDLDTVFPGQEVAGAAFFPDADYVESHVYSSDLDRSNYPEPEGDLFFDNDDEPFQYMGPGGAGFTILLHEIGHALGLKHPFDDGDNFRPTFEDLGIESRDRMRYTVMSYDIAQPPYGPEGFAETIMPLDILAIQHIYGANMSYRAGDDRYVLDNDSFRTIWDAGGRDVLTAASWSRPGGVQIDLQAGEFSGHLDGQKRMAIAYGVTIENAIGSAGDDVLFGNAAANTIAGRVGADALFGRAGNDVLRGGAGSDRLEGGAGNDVLVCTAGDSRLDGGAGRDTLRLAVGDLDLRIGSGTHVTGIERVDMRGSTDNTLTLSALAALDLSSTSNKLTVLGGAGDTVDITGIYIDKGITGDFHRYRLGAAVLLVDSDIAVV